MISLFLLLSTKKNPEQHKERAINVKREVAVVKRNQIKKRNKKDDYIIYLLNTHHQLII